MLGVVKWELYFRGFSDGCIPEYISSWTLILRSWFYIRLALKLAALTWALITLAWLTLGSASSHGLHEQPEQPHLISNVSYYLRMYYAP